MTTTTPLVDIEALVAVAKERGYTVRTADDGVAEFMFSYPNTVIARRLRVANAGQIRADTVLVYNREFPESQESSLPGGVLLTRQIIEAISFICTFLPDDWGDK